MTLFISYSSLDTDAVVELERDLMAFGKDVWRDDEILGGEDWWAAILHQIRECEALIFAISQNSLDSDPCAVEVEYARALGIPVLPVEIGEVEPEVRRNHAVYSEQLIDYRQASADNAIKLMRAVNERAASRPPLPDPLPPEPPIPYEYLLRLGAVVRQREPISYEEQSQLVAQFRDGLFRDRNESVRSSIRRLLGELKARPETGRSIEAEIDELLERYPRPGADTPGATAGGAAGAMGAGAAAGLAAGAAAGQAAGAAASGVAPAPGEGPFAASPGTPGASPAPPAAPSAAPAAPTAPASAPNAPAGYPPTAPASAANAPAGYPPTAPASAANAPAGYPPTGMPPTGYPGQPAPPGGGGGAQPPRGRRLGLVLGLAGGGIFVVIVIVVIAVLLWPKAPLTDTTPTATATATTAAPEAACWDGAVAATADDCPAFTGEEALRYAFFLADGPDGAAPTCAPLPNPGDEYDNAILVLDCTWADLEGTSVELIEYDLTPDEVISQEQNSGWDDEFTWTIDDERIGLTWEFATTLDSGDAWKWEAVYDELPMAFSIYSFAGSGGSEDNVQEAWDRKWPLTPEEIEALPGVPE